MRVSASNVASAYVMKTGAWKRRASVEHLKGLLGAMHGLYWLQWTTHWQVKGDPSYGDHLLFERLYKGMVEEIDTLAEKMVQLYGKDAVAVDGHFSVAGAWLAQWQDPDPVGRVLGAERDFQKAIKDTYDDLKALGGLSLGMDDFLMSVANAHETNLYLLQQRMGGIQRTAALSSRVRKQVDQLVDWARPLEIDDLATEFRTSWRDLQREYPEIYRTWKAVDFEEAARYLSNRSKLGAFSGEGSLRTARKRGEPDMSAEGHFFDHPRARETREFAESGALTNDAGVAQAAFRGGEGDRKLQRAVKDSPLTVAEVLNETPGSDEFSTLSRYLVQTVQPTDPGVPTSRDDIPKHPDIK